MVKIDDNIGEDVIEKVDTAVKIMDTLIFNNIKTDYTLHVTKSKIGLRDFVFKIWVHIDVDKMYVKSPTYDDKYKDYVYDIESKIINALRYVGLHNHIRVINFTYVNEDLVIAELKKLNDILTSLLISKYNVTKEEIIHNYINYHLYQSIDEQPIVTVIFVGLDIEDGEENVLVGCDELYDIMKSLYEDSPLSESFSYENELCV
jgi:hypothetical protein